MEIWMFNALYNKSLVPWTMSRYGTEITLNGLNVDAKYFRVPFVSIVKSNHYSQSVSPFSGWHYFRCSKSLQIIAMCLCRTLEKPHVNYWIAKTNRISCFGRCTYAWQFCVTINEVLRKTKASNQQNQTKAKKQQ